MFYWAVEIAEVNPDIVSARIGRQSLGSSFHELLHIFDDLGAVVSSLLILVRFLDDGLNGARGAGDLEQAGFEECILCRLLVSDGRQPDAKSRHLCHQ